MANYLLRILLKNGAVDVLVQADNDESALDMALTFVGYEDETAFELYDVKAEVARRVC